MTSESGGPLDSLIRPIDADALGAAYRGAGPFPFIKIDGFLEPEFASAIVSSLPEVARARRIGHSFNAVNETGKTQITNTEHFAEPVQRLHSALAHPDWLALLSRITGIPSLLADERLDGGGIHVMTPGALLDVHVDFNLIQDRKLHRRLNILVFFNEGWEDGWGGQTEFWNDGVTECRHAFAPLLNRCVVFETSDRSFHGVRRLTPPSDRARYSFAAYYYTREAPTGWDGKRHSTVFRARPDEHLKRYLLMPASRIHRTLMRPVNRLRRTADRIRGVERPR